MIEKSYCFVEGTLITYYDTASIPIERLINGDSLFSAKISTLEDTNRLSKLYLWSSTYLGVRTEFSPIVKINPKVVPYTIQLNEGLLEATPRHTQLACRDGVWRFFRFQDLQLGDLLRKITGEDIEITNIKTLEGDKLVYPLTLKNPHLYYANGILTHNTK